MAQNRLNTHFMRVCVFVFLYSKTWHTVHSNLLISCYFTLYGWKKWNKNKIKTKQLSVALDSLRARCCMSCSIVCAQKYTARKQNYTKSIDTSPLTPLRFLCVCVCMCVSARINVSNELPLPLPYIVSKLPSLIPLHLHRFGCASSKQIASSILVNTQS